MNQEFELIAKTFQGLEEVLAQELTELGASNIESDDAWFLSPETKP